MKLKYLQKTPEGWNEPLPKSAEYPRHWITVIDFEIELSDGYVLKVPKGTIWDGASIPSWLWWLANPIDEGALGDFIHDQLWIDKQAQLEYFKFDIYQARKFADEERVKWRNALAPKKRLKTAITNFVIRAVGGLFYSRQLKIPE